MIDILIQVIPPEVPEIIAKTGVMQQSDDAIAVNKRAPITLLPFFIPVLIFCFYQVYQKMDLVNFHI